MKATKNPRIFELNGKSLISDLISPLPYKGIVIHHAQYTVSDNYHLVFDIDNWHKEKAIKAGWGGEWHGIWYGHVIERDGTPYQTVLFNNGIEQVGVIGNSPEREYNFNKDFTHICLSGNGDKQKITEIQLENLLNLCHTLASVYPMESGLIFTHGMLSNEKTCPGFYINKYFYAIAEYYQKGVLSKGSR